MALKDVIQSKRKFKRPQMRKWTYARKGGWGYYSTPGTKKKLSAFARKAKSSRRIHYTVAYAGREYGPKEFLKKYPKFETMAPGRRVARQIVRKKFRPRRRPVLF